MKEGFIRSKWWKIGLCLLVYGLLSLPMAAITGHGIHLMMAWNVLLAMLPLVFAYLSSYWFNRGKRVSGIVFALLWLLFFPNAPYLVTDMLHVSGFAYAQQHPLLGTVYIQDVLAWARLLFIGLGIALGTTAGMLSLKAMHRLARRFWGKWIAWGCVGAVCLLSGYGIYIGRFLRFNSWDVLLPFSLIRRLMQDFDGAAALFSLLFGGFIVLCYGLVSPFLSLKLFNQEDIIMQNNQVIQAIMDRRSIRAYEDKPVSRETLQTLVDCGLNAPSARNLQPWHVSVLTNKELLAQMNKAFADQVGEEFMAERPGYQVNYGAPAVIFVAGNESNPYCGTDSGMLTQNICLAAHSLGLGTCIAGMWRESFKQDEGFLKQLQIPEGFRVFYGIAVGYPAQCPDAKPRENKAVFID